MMRLAAAWSPARLTDSTHREFAIAEAKRRERARRRIAAHDPLVDAMREARDHQLQIALIAPEPGQFIVGLGLADEGGPKMRR